MWIAGAQLGLSVLGGLLGGSAQRRAARTQATLTRAQTYANEVTREARNIAGAAENNLAGFVRSLNNQRLSRAAGEQYNYLGEVLQRTIDSATSGTLSRRVEAAEQAGAVAAQTAWAGVGGSTVDIIDGTMRLRDQVIEEGAKRNQNYLTYDMVRQRVGVVEAGIESMDMTQSFAQMDLQRTLTPYTHSPGWDSILTDTLLQAAPQALQAWQNYRDSRPTSPTPRASPGASGAVLLVGTTANASQRFGLR